MSQPEENEEKSDKTDPILAPPTANPDRVRVPPEGIRHHRPDEETDREQAGSRPEEER